MNKTETLYASILEGHKRAGAILDWKFEGIKLRLADGAWYTPDFIVWVADGRIELVEIKGGFCREAALVRYKVAREMYPLFDWKFKQHRHGRWIDK